MKKKNCIKVKSLLYKALSHEKQQMGYQNHIKIKHLLLYIFMLLYIFIVSIVQSSTEFKPAVTNASPPKKPLPKKTIVISITLPCYFPFKTSNSAIVIHCIHFIKLLTNFNLFKLTLLTRFYRPFDSISFHKHPCKDASNNRIWVISLFTKNKKFQCTLNFIK